MEFRVFGRYLSLNSEDSDVMVPISIPSEVVHAGLKFEYPAYGSTLAPGKDSAKHRLAILCSPIDLYDSETQWT